MEDLTKKYKDEISFTLSCYDRIIIKGAMPEISYAGGMTDYLYINGIKIFDYSKFAEPHTIHIKPILNSAPYYYQRFRQSI